MGWRNTASDIAIEETNLSPYGFLVPVRDGPNVRQSFDAAWANYETGL
jgi:hypothetical protein